MSNDTKSLIAVLCLLFAYHIGLIVMFSMTDWKPWVKHLIALPVYIVVLNLLVMLAFLLISSVQPGHPDDPTIYTLPGWFRVIPDNIAYFTTPR